MKENKKIVEFEDDYEIIKPPYYRIMYVDDRGVKHIATIQDAEYLAFIKDRYGLVECVFIEK